jgi:inhibitor of cysteine peptidase
VNRRGLRVGVALSVLVAGIFTAAAGPVAAVNELADGIAPGVVRANDGFGTSTVIVPQDGYVTYFVQGAANLAGTPVQIWTNTTGEWALATTRAFSEDGTAHYFARLTGRTGVEARIPGTPGGSAHGRSATTWPAATDRRTRISVGCDDFATEDNASVLVGRTVALKSGTQVDVVLCSNPSTGFEWQAAAIDSARLRLVGHHFTVTSDLVGAPGTETWSFRVVGSGKGHGVLVYSQPWEGGQKAVEVFVLTTLS